MPRTPINYTNTNFYKIVCNDWNINDCYVGHTTNFKRRRFQHKRNTTSQTSQSYNARVYTFIRANGGWDNFDMVLIDNRACANSLEARKIERNYIEDLQATLNCQIPTRTPQEHYQDNKEHITERVKEYYTNNKNEINNKNMEYYETHKEAIQKQIKLYRNNNKDKLQQCKTVYYQKNRGIILEAMREYSVINRDKILEKHVCECGKDYTRSHKLRHERSMFHQQCIQSINNIEEL
jgi:predicted GIY-YIG superfamily endonuclease